MAYDLVKMERGQVWFVRVKEGKSFGHEQAKDRPWLVVSSGKFNHTSSMVTAVPITTRNNCVTPAQVLFINDKNVKNIIMCEQIKTFDVSSGAYVFEYMGVLSSNIMDKVEEALAFHLGLKYGPVSLKILFDSIESFVSKVISAKSASTGLKFTDDDVLNFAEKLQTTTESLFSKDSNNGVVISKDDSRDEGNRNQKPEKNEAKESTAKPSRIKWTKEIAQQFLTDANTYPMLEVMKKWNILKKTRFYSMKRYAEDLLKMMNTQKQ